MSEPYQFHLLQTVNHSPDSFGLVRPQGSKVELGQRRHRDGGCGSSETDGNSTTLLNPIGQPKCYQKVKRGDGRVEVEGRLPEEIDRVQLNLGDNDSKICTNCGSWMARREVCRR